jgi:hypothetical protein
VAKIGISQPSSLVLEYSRIQRNYLWDVLLPDINFPLGNLAGGILQGMQGLAMTQYVQAVRFGDYTVEKTMMKYGPYRASFPGLLTVESATITFLKPRPDFISSYFYAWKDLMVSRDGLYQPKNKYQKPVYIRFLDSTGVAINRYRLTGCFPLQFPSYNLDYDNNTVTKFSVTLAIDRIEIQ